MRLNELAHLNRVDLDFARHQVRVVFGKGQKQRMAPFPQQAQRPMLRYLNFRDDDHKALWLTEERIPLMYYGIYQDVRRIVDRAGVEAQDAVHIFRRTFGANAVEAGVPREFTQASAGWSDPRMLADYVAALQDEHGKAIESFTEIDPLAQWLGNYPHIARN